MAKLPNQGNYQKDLEAILGRIEQEGRVPRLLIQDFLPKQRVKIHGPASDRPHLAAPVEPGLDFFSG